MSRAEDMTAQTVHTHSSGYVDMRLCHTEAEWGGGTKLTDLQLCHKQIT